MLVHVPCSAVPQFSCQQAPALVSCAAYPQGALWTPANLVAPTAAPVVQRAALPVSVFPQGTQQVAPPCAHPAPSTVHAQAVTVPPPAPPVTISAQLSDASSTDYHESSPPKTGTVRRTRRGGRKAAAARAAHAFKAASVSPIGGVELRVDPTDGSHRSFLGFKLRHAKGADFSFGEFLWNQVDSAPRPVLGEADTHAVVSCAIASDAGAGLTADEAGLSEDDGPPLLCDDDCSDSDSAN